MKQSKVKIECPFAKLHTDNSFVCQVTDRCDHWHNVKGCQCKGIIKARYIPNIKSKKNKQNLRENLR